MYAVCGELICLIFFISLVKPFYSLEGNKKKESTRLLQLHAAAVFCWAGGTLASPYNAALLLTGHDDHLILYAYVVGQFLNTSLV